jgi:hypothetical protein
LFLDGVAPVPRLVTPDIQRRKAMLVLAPLEGGTTMGALANLYAISDWSIQQIAAGLVILPLLLALTWYVSHPVHRRRLSSGTHAQERPPRMAA